MTNWIVRGLLRGQQSTRYPARPETAEGVSPGRPTGTPMTAEEAQAAASVCPTAALAQGVHGLVVDHARCVHCQRCLRSETPASWDESYEWAAVAGGAAGAAAGRSSVRCMSVIRLRRMWRLHG